MRTRRTTGEAAALVGLFALVALYAFSPIFCVDFHWHLAIGRVIAERGAIPRIDLFSAVHPERPYVQFNWLWDFLAFRAYEAGGLRAIRSVQALSMVASFAILHATARRALGRPNFTLFVCALALVLFEDRFRVRPDALTLGFVACLLPLIVGDTRSATRGVLLATLALGALWSNLHGGASVLLPLSTGAVALGATLNSRLFGRADRVRDSWFLFGASVFGVALSPTTLPGLAHWFEAIGPQIATGNEEWQPTWTMLRNGFTPSFVVIALGPTVAAVAYAVFEVRRVRRSGRSAIDFAEWLVAAGYLLLAHQAVRNAFLCVVPVVFLLRRVGEIAPATVPAARDGASSRLARALAIAAFLLAAVSFHDHVIEGYGGISNAVALIGYDLAPDTYPEEAADFIAEAGLEGGILNEGAWGGYLIWRTWPACHVFVDTRHDLTATMWPVFLRAHDPLRRPAAMEEAFRRWGVELAVFRGPTFPLIMAPPNWQLLYKAGDQEVYQRLGAAHADANLTRTREALRLSGHAPRNADGAALAEAATAAGAGRWLDAPYQRRRAGRAHVALASDAPEQQARGHRIRGDLLFSAGAYARAAADLDQAAVLTPDDARSRSLAALAHFALGHADRARAELAALRAPAIASLSPVERGRLALLARALGDQ